jgi:LmbE family N-acetylglucosaminyl deacetylase
MEENHIPESAMVIVAHPDDAEFTVAGTVALWTKAGCRVTYVVCTDGNSGSHELHGW